jgi:hypothetical protein
MSNPPPPSSKVPAVADPLNVMRARLIRAIFAMSEKAHTATRSILDSYGRHVNPTAAVQGETLFPHNPRAHHRYPDRTSNFGLVAVQLSLVGIAVLGYYDAVLKREGAVAVLEKRIAFLEEINKWRKIGVTGSDALGFTLVEIAETEAERQQRVKDEK